MPLPTPTYRGALCTVFGCAFAGALFVDSRLGGIHPAAPWLALVYAGFTALCAAWGIRSAAVAIEASERGLDPWLRMFAWGSPVAYAAIGATTAYARHPGANEGQGIALLLLFLAPFGYARIAHVASAALADEIQDGAFRRLMGGAGPQSVRTSAAQGHRLGQGLGPAGGGAAAGASNAPRPPVPKVRSKRPKKPLAGSPLDGQTGDRDFLR